MNARWLLHRVSLGRKTACIFKPPKLPFVLRSFLPFSFSLLEIIPYWHPSSVRDLFCLVSPHTFFTLHCSTSHNSWTSEQRHNQHWRVAPFSSSISASLGLWSVAIDSLTERWISCDPSALLPFFKSFTMPKKPPNFERYLEAFWFQHF